ncbi:MAG: hypothetical protein HY906_19010 [Deltaproteobacteria bacterium]|nr:hypothetical protein [Deltaproteobacteria bacterium]
MRLTVWSEFLPSARVIADLPALGAAGVDLNLGVTRCDGLATCPGVESLDAAEAVIRAAATAGVTVRLWPELPLEEGRWANVKTLDAFAAWVRQLLSFVRDRGLPVPAIVFDMETSYQKLQQIQQYAADGQLNDLVGFLQADADPAAYAAAKDDLRALIDEVKEAGLEAHCSTLAQVLDDGSDEGIQRALDIPIDGLPWDRVSIQVYRTLMDELYATAAHADGGFTPDLVHSYAVSAVERYGDRAGLDLGLVAAPGTFTGYDEPAGLLADIAAARAAGVPYGQLNVFALDGLDGRADFASWLPPDPGAGAAPERARSTDDVRNIFLLLDLAMQ